MRRCRRRLPGRGRGGGVCERGSRERSTRARDGSRRGAARRAPSIRKVLAGLRARGQSSAPLPRPAVRRAPPRRRARSSRRGPASASPSASTVSRVVGPTPEPLAHGRHLGRVVLVLQPTVSRRDRRRSQAQGWTSGERIANLAKCDGDPEFRCGAVAWRRERVMQSAESPHSSWNAACL